MTLFNEAYFYSFSFENDLSPEQFVTIKHKHNLKIVPHLEKQPGFICLIIWYNANKFDSPDTEGGVGTGVKVSKLNFDDTESKSRSSSFSADPKPWVRLPYQEINGLTICSIVEQDITLRYFYGGAPCLWKGAAWERLQRNSALSKELVSSWIIVLKLCYVIS